MSKRAGPAVLLGLVVLAALSAGAQEGGGDPHLRTAFDRITPPAAGVTVTIKNAPPALPLLTLRNESDRLLEVTGFDLEPFLRIGPAGVQANKRSRTFYITQDPTGSQSIPQDAKAGATPTWVTVSQTPEWGWFEPRARWTAPLPAGVATAKSDVVLGAWTIRARLGQSSMTIEGHMFWHPTLGTVRSRLTSAAGDTGLTITVVEGPVPGLVVNNSSDKRLDLASRDGAPFARVGPGGVDVNMSSATARDNPRFGGGTAKGWKHVQDAPVLSWLEKRAAYSGEEPSGKDAARRHILVSWTLPATLGGSAVAITGVTEWIPVASAAPPKSSAHVPIGLAALGALAVAAAITFTFRARRSA